MNGEDDTGKLVIDLPLPPGLRWRGNTDALERVACDLDDEESGCSSKCRANRDGDCNWRLCPQRKYRRQHPRSTRHCPLDFICKVHDP